ncbi:MAG: AsmA family protein, partial [Pseudomonadota bacterium]|nr:AsmA family protein [Pseudomonadota bacterium]
MLKKSAKAGFHAGRFFLWLLLSLFALSLLVAVLLASLDASHYKELLVAQVESATGRKLVIDGEAGFTLSLVPTIYVEKVRFANADWGTRPWMFSARRIEVSINPVSLLKKELQLADVNIVEPVFWIEKDDAGTVNWDLRKKLQEFIEAKPKTSLGWLFVQRLDASDGSVEYPQWGSEQVVKFGSLKIRIDDETRRAKVRIKGSIGEQPLDARGELDSFETLVNRQHSKMELRVHYGDSRVTARGTARDLLSWDGASVDFDLELHRLSDLSHIFPVKLPAFGPLKGTARLEQPEKWRSLRIQDISVISRQPGLNAQLSGRWGGPDAPEKTDLRLLADGGLASVLASVDVDTSAPLQISADARLLGGSDGYRLALPTLRLQGDGVTLRSSGGAEGVFSGIHAQIPVEAEISSLQKIGVLFGFELPDWGPISGTAMIVNGEGRIALEQIEVEMTGKALQAHVEGQVDDLLARSGGKLTLTASSLNLKQFEAFEGVKISLPPLKKLQLEGSVTLDQGELSAEVEQLIGREDGVEVVVNGTIGDLLHFDDVKLHASGHAKSLLNLNPLFDIGLPAFGPLDVAGDLLREGRGPIDFGNVEAKLSDKEVDMGLSGAFSDLGSKMQVRFDVELTAGSMASFSSLAGFELPAEGPVKATAKVLAEGPKNWRMEALNARLEHPEMQLAASGRIDSLFRSWLPDLSVSVDNLNTTRLAALWDTKIPLRGTINAQARAERAEGKPLSLRNIRGSLEGEGLSVAVSGRLGQLKPLGGMDLAVNLNADNTSRIGWLKDSGLQSVGPVGAAFSVTSE